MTQLEVLRKLDRHEILFSELTEYEKLYVLTEDIDTVADRLAMLKDDNENSIITEEMIQKVRKLANFLYNVAEYQEDTESTL